VIQKKTISFEFIDVDNPDELSPGDLELVMAARKAASNAYAPYSLFRVGAAVRLESGIIISGTNVENAASPSGICAERNVLSNCISNYQTDKPVAIAIAANTEEGLTENPVPPCGNCRQVILEEEIRNNKNIKIILSGRNRFQVIESGRYLLPLQFTQKNLNINPHL
jgi:cytidine deaminase